MNKCCLKDFWAYVQKHYSENWKTYGWMLLIEAIILILINIIDTNNNADRTLDTNQSTLYIVFGFIFALGAVHVSMKDNYGRNGLTYYTLPVSQASRFAFGIVNSIVQLLLFTVVFMLCTLPWADNLPANNKAIWSVLANIGTYRYCFMYIYMFLCLHSSYMFIESLIKGNVLGTYVICIILLGLLVALPNIPTMICMSDLTTDSPSLTKSMHMVSSGTTVVAFQDIFAGNLLLDVVMYALACMIPAVLYVSAYFKFRERQL